MSPNYDRRYFLRFHPLRITIWIAFLIGVLVPWGAHSLGIRGVARHLLWPGRTLISVMRLPTENLQVIYMTNFLLMLLVVYVVVHFAARVRAD
jgi:hypothetical protein